MKTYRNEFFFRWVPHIERRNIRETGVLLTKVSTPVQKRVEFWFDILGRKTRGCSRTVSGEFIGFATCRGNAGCRQTIKYIMVLLSIDLTLSLWRKRVWWSGTLHLPSPSLSRRVRYRLCSGTNTIWSSRRIIGRQLSMFDVSLSKTSL